MLLFFFFFNGLSFHLSAAFASHLLGFKMSWGSTTKEVKDTNFFKEVRCWTFLDHETPEHSDWRSNVCAFLWHQGLSHNMCMLITACHRHLSTPASGPSQVHAEACSMYAK